MFLEKLVITGFKSFADKTILEFPRPKNRNSFSITAIVGPNGSGKSNIVEAIRWGLGEQSLKILRSKKSEDVIFSGSDKRARLNSAEVALYFNNEDRAAPIDYNQFVITRRINRRGEGEYLLNNSRVRLQDILILLAQSNFGQKSYSIIGQGTIDSILHSSSSERKSFFDEATGIKQYQIKKEEAIRKLEKTKTNLQQAEIALQEIEPRMRSLTRQIKKLERRQKFEEELKNLQEKYYGNFWQSINQQFSFLNRQIVEVEKKKKTVEAELGQLQKQLESMAFEKISDDYQKMQEEQQKLINLKNEYLEKITILRGQLVIEQEKLKQDKRIKKIDYQKVVISLKELKNLQDELIEKMAEIRLLDEIENFKNKATEISKKIDVLIQYLTGEDQEIKEQDVLLNIEQEIKNLDFKIKELNEKIFEASRKLTEFAEKEQEKRKSLFDLQRKVQIKQSEFNNISDELNNLYVERARIETKKENLKEEIKREMGIEITDDNFFTKSALEQINEQNQMIENLYSEIQRIKHQLELIGGIDPEVEKEYPICKERWEFLSTQIRDLKSALQSLNQIIKQLDEKIESQFKQTFHQINEKFDYYFKVFFGGGKAKIIITESQKSVPAESLIETELQKKLESQNQQNLENKTEPEVQVWQDIEIMANPPGKKLKNIEALSGGERALTCLALICAIIAINKPPFVVLDEVDAALDEENSTRFANIIKDLADKTQFILITHNRQTMEAADILYGVTIGKDGVSNLLSMKF